MRLIALALALLPALALAQTPTDEMHSGGSDQSLATVWQGHNEVAVGDILTAPNKFDRQSVAIQGTVIQAIEKTSGRGNDYATIKVQDRANGPVITVFTWGHPGIKDGTLVKCEGLFQEVKFVGQYKFENQIDGRCQ